MSSEQDKKILLAVDGSNNLMRSTQEAVKIASMCDDCAVEIVYVADFSRAKKEMLNVQSKEELDLARREMLLPFEEQLEKKFIKHKLTILHGESGPVIADYANKGDFDLVVMGSRGRNPFQEMVLGSVSHKVAKRAKIPVMIVK